jgi:hypothetical protein
MTREAEFWRQDAVTKAESIARDIEQLAWRARAARLSVTAYILEMAAKEARKELRIEGETVAHDRA